MRLPERWLDATFLRYLETQADDPVTIEQVRSALAKIPGSMVEDFRRERDADKDLLAVASAEGLAVFDPENP